MEGKLEVALWKNKLTLRSCLQLGGVERTVGEPFDRRGKKSRRDRNLLMLKVAINLDTDLGYIIQFTAAVDIK